MKKLLFILLLFTCMVCNAQRDSISNELTWSYKTKPGFRKFTTHDDIIYTNTYRCIYIYEIEDYLTLNNIGEYPFEGSYHKIEYSNDKLYLFHYQRIPSAYLMDYTRMITVLDISDTDSIFELYTYDFSSSCIGTEVAFKEDTMFCIRQFREPGESYYSYSFDIYYMADSTGPELIQAHNLETFRNDMVVNNNYAYLVNKVSSSDDILLLDLSDHSDIRESYFSTGNQLKQCMELKDTLLFTVNIIGDTLSSYNPYAGHVSVYNVSNPESLIFLSETNFRYISYDYSSTVFNDSLMFYTSNYGLAIISFSNPEEIYTEFYDSNFTSPGFIYDNYYYDQYTCYYDFSVPESLSFDGKLYRGISCKDMELIGDYLYMDNYSHFTIASINEADTFDLLRTIYNERSYDFFNLSISDSFAVLSHIPGPKIVNISDPANPFEVYSFDSTYCTHALIEDTLLYQWNNSDGMSIYNISTPTSPVLLSSIERDDCRDCTFYVHDYYLYICHSHNVLEIYDITNPEELEIAYISRLNFRDNAHHAIFDDLFVVNTETGLKLYDISDPYSLVEFSEFAFTDEINDIECKNHYLYIATDDYIDIYDIWNPESPVFAHRIYNERNDCISIGNNFLFTSSSPLKKISLSFVPNYDFTPGWNLVSYPYIDTVDISSTIPVTETPAFTYNTESRAYDETSELFSNYGFWILSSNYGDFDIDDSHIPAASLTLELAPGWNLIGGTFTDVPGSIFESYPEIISPPFYYNRYDRAYEESDTLINHIGYWILSSDSVEITIP